jgi:NADPH-dependent FMN reductase
MHDRRRVRGAAARAGAARRGDHLATPLYWYGVSGQLKTFLDRLFCYIAASEPESELFVRRLIDKRLALLVASEESYPGAPLGVITDYRLDTDRPGSVWADAEER